MKCDELKIEYVGYGRGFYPTEKVDAAIDELKDELNNQKWRGDEWARNANDKDKQIAELKAENRKLHSCLKCLVMRDLIKDCPEKKSAIEIVKEY